MTDGHVQPFAVRTDRHSSGTCSDGDRLHDFVRARIDDADRSGALVRDENQGGKNHHFNVVRNAAMSRLSAGVTWRFGIAFCGSMACGFCNQFAIVSGLFGYLPAMYARDAM